MRDIMTFVSDLSPKERGRTQMPHSWTASALGHATYGLWQTTDYTCKRSGKTPEANFLVATTVNRNVRKLFSSLTFNSDASDHIIQVNFIFF